MLAAFVLVAARGAARRAARAVADAARTGRAAGTAAARPGRRHWPRRLRRRDLVPAHGQHPRAAALPRQGHDRARIARRPPAGIGRDDRPSRAAGLSRPPLDAAQSGVRARPHVHVAVLDVRVDAAARRDGGAADVDPSRAGAAGAVRAAHGAHVHLAAGDRARRTGTRRPGQPAGASLFTTATTAPPGKEVRVTGIGARLATGSARGVGALVRARCRRPLGLGAVAHAGVGRLRRRLRGAIVFVASGSTRIPASVLLVLAAGARLSAYIGAHRGRNRVPPRLLDGRSRRLAWLEDYAASLVASADRRRPGPAHFRHPLRSCVVRLSRHGASGAGRCVVRPAGGRGGGTSSARTAPARRRW